MSETRSGPPPHCPRLEEDEDYDAWVLAGGRLFRAHTSVLASHSGYLRAAAVGAAGGGGGGERDIRLLLPHVPPAGFASILTYMYTGRLPLTPATLYEVLVAGHLLQMASVVSLCQALLSTPTTANTSLGLSEVPPALSVWRGLARLVPPHQHTAAPSLSSLPTTIVRPTPTRPRPSQHPLNPPQDLTRDREAMEEVITGTLGEEGSLAPHPDENRALDSGNSSYAHKADVENGRRVNKGAVVIDVAACDGPVFFERVINRAYKANPLVSQDDSETETEINVDEIDSSEEVSNRAHGGDPLDGSGDNDSNGLAKILRLRSTGEMQRSALTASPPIPNNQVSRTYHCVYCNHTFKSHYCYQKHMRRHINPITVEVDKLHGTSISSPGATDNLQDRGNQTGGKERMGESSSARVAGSVINGSVKSGSVSPYSSQTLSPSPSEGLKILDLNVQYFPCKTCGSKFPSYYFVHKHRRLCHQEEESSSFDKKSTKPTPPTSKPSTPTPTTINSPNDAITTTVA